MSRPTEFLLLLAAGICAGNSGAVAAAEWKPEQPVEVIVTAASGSNNDTTMRTIQGIWQEQRIGLLSQVNNKPGGGGAIAYSYLAQRPRDPHYLMVLAPTMLTNHIMGIGTFHHNDFTAIALLVSRHVYVIVRDDSPIRTGKDLIERLRKDPASLSVAVSAAMGNAIHMGIALPMKAAGVDVKKMKVVVFNSASTSMTNLLGGHVDVVACAFGTVLPHLEAGRVRVVGVAASERQAGMLANVPTWKEQGANAVVYTWLGIVGTKGITASQAAYWENAFATLNQSEAWKKDMEKNYQVSNYMPGREARKFWDAQYVQWKEVLTEISLAKRGD